MMSIMVMDHIHHVCELSCGTLDPSRHTCVCYCVCTEVTEVTEVVLGFLPVLQ